MMGELKPSMNPLHVAKELISVMSKIIKSIQFVVIRSPFLHFLI